MTRHLHEGPIRRDPIDVLVVFAGGGLARPVPTEQITEKMRLRKRVW